MTEVNGYEVTYKDGCGNIRTAVVGGVNEDYAIAMFVRKYSGWYTEFISIKEMD